MPFGPVCEIPWRARHDPSAALETDELGAHGSASIYRGPPLFADALVRLAVATFRGSASVGLAWLGHRVHAPHVARRNSSTEQVRRSLYLTQRAIGDAQALRRGTLPKRLVRRSLVRALLRGWR